MASETNIVQRHRPRLFTSYAFGWYRGGIGGDFKVDTVTEEFCCLECWFSTPQTSGKAWRTFYICPSQKRELAEEIITPLEFKKAVTTSTSKEEFAKAFILYIKRSEKCVQIGWVLAKKNLQMNSLLSQSAFFFWRILFGWNSPHMYVCRKTKVSLLSFIVRKNIPVQELVTKLLQALLYYST